MQLSKLFKILLKSLMLEGYCFDIWIIGIVAFSQSFLGYNIRSFKKFLEKILLKSNTLKKVFDFSFELLNYLSI